MNIILKIDRKKFNVSMQFVDIEHGHRYNSVVRSKDYLFDCNGYQVYSCGCIDIGSNNNIYLPGWETTLDNDISVARFRNIHDSESFYKDMKGIVEKLKEYLK
jgi:hypothetical protein